MGISFCVISILPSGNCLRLFLRALLLAINNSKRRDKRAVKLSDAFINKLGARYSLLSVNSPSADLTISAIFNVVKSSVDSDSNNILKFVFATPISLSPAPVFSSLIFI